MRYICDPDGYQALFDQQSGVYIRNGNPFWRSSGPELLDISITNYCERCCEFCYRESDSQGLSMSLPLYEYVISEARKCGVSQVALGGGNPNQHPQFIDILRMTREYGIVPSYTTNGQGMTAQIYKATRKYAGAIAVSWYDDGEDAKRVIQHCKEYGIPVNIHVILDNDSIENVMPMMENAPLDQVNAVIFLNYKPVGKSHRQVLRHDDSVNESIRNLIIQNRVRVGFDSCMISHLVKTDNIIDSRSIDFCEAGRFSAFVDENGFVYPCSFMCGAGYEGYDIRESGLKKIWQYAAEFTSIRQELMQHDRKCEDCEGYNMCHGGCPVFEINC